MRKSIGGDCREGSDLRSGHGAINVLLDEWIEELDLCVGGADRDQAAFAEEAVALGVD